MSSPLRNVEPSPRVKLALQLYTTAAAKTKRQASRMAGLHPNYLTMLTNNSLPVQREQDELEARLKDKAIEVAPIMQELGRRALAKLNQLMNTAKDEVQLRAAIDLADRSPETAKTQKFDVTSMTLTGQDVQALAKALVESSEGKSKYAHVAEHGLEEVQLLQPPLVEPQYEQGRTEGHGGSGREASTDGKASGQGSEPSSDSPDARAEG